MVKYLALSRQKLIKRKKEQQLKQKMDEAVECLKNRKYLSDIDATEFNKDEFLSMIITTLDMETLYRYMTHTLFHVNDKDPQVIEYFTQVQLDSEIKDLVMQLAAQIAQQSLARKPVNSAWIKKEIHQIQQYAAENKNLFVSEDAISAVIMYTIQNKIK